jgi:hypothetical protein
VQRVEERVAGAEGELGERGFGVRSGVWGVSDVMHIGICM